MSVAMAPSALRIRLMYAAEAGRKGVGEGVIDGDEDRDGDDDLDDGDDGGDGDDEDDD